MYSERRINARINEGDNKRECNRPKLMKRLLGPDM